MRIAIALVCLALPSVVLAQSVTTLKDVRSHRAEQQKRDRDAVCAQIDKDKREQVCGKQ